MADAAAFPNDPVRQQRLAEAPRQEHDFYWSAFWELNTERPSSMGIVQIPVSAIEAYSEKPILRFTLREQWAFKSIMRTLDHAYIEVESERQKAATRAARKGR